MVGCKVWPEAWDVGLDTLDIPFHIVMLNQVPWHANVAVRGEVC